MAPRSNIIPDGYELLAGRSRENAREALQRASDRGLDPSLVRTIREGYLIPGAEPESDETPTEDWSVADIDAWADAREIEVSGKKAEKVAQINEALAAQKEGE